MTKYLTLIFKNLLRSKRRNHPDRYFDSRFAVHFSVLVSVPTFANQMLADTASSVRVICRTKMGFGYPLPESYQSKIESMPHVVCRGAGCFLRRDLP